MSDPRFDARRRGGLLDRWRRTLIIVFCVVLVGGIVWLGWFSALFAVRTVVIDGETTLTASQIRTEAEVPVGRPLARVDTVGIESRVASMERVQEVKVSRSWPSTIRIEVVERIPIAYAVLGDEIRALDRYGIAFRTFEKKPKDLLEVRVTIGDPRGRQQTLESAASVVEVIERKDPSLRKLVQFVSATSKDSIVLDLTEGRTVTWGSAGNVTRKLAVLKSLLTIKAKAYDVSAPDQPTTRK